MKINKEQLDALMRLPDDRLWGEIVRMAAGYGFVLPAEVPPKEQMEKLRGAAGAGKISAMDALRLLNEYKKRK